ncbi:MAG TPA: L,D-transpeptidase [Rhodoblastus sp.]|nr:L,D-transpeptidase [Rhodoblastus sp.]
MARRLALLFVCLPFALGPGATGAAAQGVTPVWPGQPAYGAQRAPDVEVDMDEYDYSRDYGRPLARPRRGAQSDEDFDESLAPGRPRQLAPQRRRAIVALPADADPAYSTAMDYDDQIDWSEQTRSSVSDPTGQAPGTITVDTHSRKLYLSLGGGRAIEYGIGVGRQGFAWKGVAQVGRKAYWPGWTPPKDMLLRRPDLPSHMEGGIENPLGARALYLFKGSKDTLFRIHGTNEPDTIGQAVSSGCIRMLNSDVVDLYKRVPKGARVVVL